MSTNLTQDEGEVSRVALEESLAVTLTAIVLSVLAIVSNSLLVYVVVRTSTLHTSTNFFIASLSVAEFLTGLFVIPFAGATVTSGGWAFSPGLCCFTAAMGVLGPCAAAFSLVVVSADRCVAISKPLQYATLVTKRSTVVVIVVVWVLSLMMALLPLSKWGSYAYSDKFRMCVMRSTPSLGASSGSDEDGSQVLSKEILSTFIPAGLVVILVLLTVKRIRGQRRVFAFVPVPVAATSLPPGSISSKHYRTKAMRSLLLISIAFVFFCVPIAVAKVMCQRASVCLVSPVVLRVLVWLSFLCCVINPLIIMTLNRKFRATLRALFCCGRCTMLRPGAGGDKEPFTITSGLQAILEATLVVNMIHGTGRPAESRRRHVIITQSTRAEMPTNVFVRRMGMVTLRKTRSSPECHIAGIAEER
ncbi:hypothetical protein BaRGS_00002190 [Batillaria attramentaria]|uniref:G-protein coupled receptors family 1 profile domain-containing protein n=1 Tax=Batillaria attramentaria TaxID=370345 RepID=A0ABD0M5B7_9CAEN